MPPLPVSGQIALFTADQMHTYARAYARAYAAEQTRELVAALEQVEAYLTPRVAHKPHGEGAAMLPELRALIAKHKGAA